MNFHIINEAEVGATECGRAMPTLGPGSMWGSDEVVTLACGDLAGFPNVAPPRGAVMCLGCWRAYEGDAPCVRADCTCDPDGPLDDEGWHRG